MKLLDCDSFRGNFCVAFVAGEVTGARVEWAKRIFYVIVRMIARTVYRGNRCS